MKSSALLAATLILLLLSGCATTSDGPGTVLRFQGGQFIEEKP
jgi:hypothetical protein